MGVMPIQPGLGELLRHLTDLLDQGSEARWRELGVVYRARYTPVLRALQDGATTVTEIRDRCRITQGAVSQTLALMEGDGLVSRHALPDRRKSEIRLTTQGEALSPVVERHWSTIFATIDELEEEVGHPVRRALVETISALERRGFADRLRRQAANLEATQ